MCNLLITEAIKKSAREDRPSGKQDDSDLLLAVIFDALRKGQLKLLKSMPAQVEEFFNNFDLRMDHAPYLTVRQPLFFSFRWRPRSEPFDKAGFERTV